MVGQSVAHYRITEFIGGGGMGVVYAAEDTRLGRRVALKFLPADAADGGPAVERFLRDVAVDADYIWVATGNGLVRFAREAIRP